MHRGCLVPLHQRTDWVDLKTMVRQRACMKGCSKRLGRKALHEQVASESSSERGVAKTAKGMKRHDETTARSQQVLLFCRLVMLACSESEPCKGAERRVAVPDDRATRAAGGADRALS